MAPEPQPDRPTVLDRLRAAFPPNRIVALVTFLTGISGLILGAADAFPEGWQNGAAAVAGILANAATALKFLDGSQKWDVLEAARDGALVIDPKANPLAVAPVNPGNVQVPGQLPPVPVTNTVDPATDGPDPDVEPLPPEDDEFAEPPGPPAVQPSQS